MLQTLALTALVLSQNPAPQPTAPQQDEWDHIRRIAESQHEIIMLLIRNGKFSRVPTATSRIFSLKFPLEKEHLFVREGRLVAGALLRQKQYHLAHQVLDQAVGAVHSSLLKAALYKEQAYLCTREGRDQDAMRLFRKALELEQSFP